MIYDELIEELALTLLTKAFEPRLHQSKTERLILFTDR